MRRKRVLLAIAASLSVLVPAGGFAVSALTDAAPAYNLQLRGCVAGPGVDLVPCITDLWFGAYDAKDLDRFYVSMDTEARAIPQLSGACHDAGHLAGRRAYAKAHDVVDLLLHVGSPTGVCNNGIIHGSLDEFAGERPDDAAYSKAIVACSTTTAQAIHDACVDGLGHGLWIGTQDIARGTRLCLEFSSERDQADCAGGIVMQMLRVDPYTGAAPYIAEDRPHIEVPPVCETMKANGATSRMIDFCFLQGAIPMVDIASKAFADLTHSGGISHAELIRQGLMLWGTQIERCGLFKEHADTCRNRMATALTWEVGDDEGLKAELCPAFPGEWEAVCLRSNSREAANKTVGE